MELDSVILGDCLEVMREMPDGSIDFIFTDPPYGHNNNTNGDLISRIDVALGRGKYNQEENRPILNDGPEANNLFKDFLVEAYRLLKKPGCCCCCGGGGGPDPQFARWSLWMDEIFQFKQMVVWDKGPMGMGWHYRRSYEVVLVGEKKGGPCAWYDTTNKIENIIRHIPKIIPSKDNHPTEKPIRLPAHFIKLHTQPGDVVLDPFCGSGSTLLAAKQNGRKYIGIELDPKWVTHARHRLKQDTDNLFSSEMLGKNEDAYRNEPLFRMEPGKPRGRL